MRQRRSKQSQFAPAFIGYGTFVIRMRTGILFSELKGIFLRVEWLTKRTVAKMSASVQIQNNARRKFGNGHIISQLDL